MENLSHIPTAALLAELEIRVGLYQAAPSMPDWARPALAAVVAVMEVTMADLLRPGSRAIADALPRMVAMAVLDATAERSLMDIAGLWGMDHGTVIHARRRIRSLVAGNPVLAAKLQSVMALVRGDGHCRATPRARTRQSAPPAH